MSRTGLTKSQVRAGRQQLLAEGRYPSVDAVRLALGNTGSKSTIHRYLKELAEEEAHDTAAPAGLRREDTARSLHALVEELAARLHDEAADRMRALEAAHAEELAALRRTVAQLQARVDELEDERAAAAAADRARWNKRGFGKFDTLMSTSRGGLRDISAFSLLSTSARSPAPGSAEAVAGLPPFPPLRM